MKSKLLALAALLLLASAANASTTTIMLDFEDGTAPVNGPVPVHTYNVGGIQFSFANATYSQPEASISISQYGPPVPFPPISVSFSEPVVSVSAQVLSPIGINNLTSTLRAFDSANTLLAIDNFTSSSGNYFGVLSVVASIGIGRIELDGQLWADAFSGFHAAFDNLNVVTTPLPAALPLFATGLGALGLLAWRRKRRA
jgi:hypothetical protein